MLSCMMLLLDDWLVQLRASLLECMLHYVLTCFRGLVKFKIEYLFIGTDSWNPVVVFSSCLPSHWTRGTDQGRRGRARKNCLHNAFIPNVMLFYIIWILAQVIFIINNTKQSDVFEQSYLIMLSGKLDLNCDLTLSYLNVWITEYKFVCRH